MKLYICNGYWKPDSPYCTPENAPIIGAVICDSPWTGIEDALDERIFYYVDDEPIVGDHGEFVIESAQPYTWLDASIEKYRN
jgi:hypothetical protein